MDLMILSFVACLVANPAECKTFEVKMDANEISIMGCYISSQAIAASWINNNPKWFIKDKIKCRNSTNIKEENI